jgi:hypothetical protein
MKMSGKVYMHIIYSTYLFKETPSVLHNSLNPRPELLAGMNDDLQGGQGDMRAFTDLSLKNASHEIT